MAALIFRATLALALCGAGLLFAPAAAGQNRLTLKLKGADGKTYRLADLRGQVVVASFGATWCGPCKAELAALEELKNEYRDRPVKFFWVSIESEKEISDKLLVEYAHDLGLTFPVLRDPAKISYGQFTQRLRVPLVVFFDREGNYVPPEQGGMSAPEMYKSRVRSRIDPLLPGR